MIDLSAILILAGGQSRRMGSPKALLPLPTGESLLDFHIRHAKKLVNQLDTNIAILIGDNDKQFTNVDGTTTIQDYIKNAGALSCLLSAFYDCKNSYQNDNLDKAYILTVSCDNLIAIDKLYVKLSNRLYADSDAQAIYLMDNHNHKDYPLLGLYRMDLLDALKLYLDKGERSVMTFLQDKSVQKIAMNDDWRYLANFNTMGEFKLALQRFHN